MIAQLTQKYLHSFLALTVTMLLSACSKPGNVAPQTVAPSQYVLKDVRYFMKGTDRVDTVTVQLKGFSVQNPGNTLTTQQVEGNFDELVKTSQFEVDQLNTLPKGLLLDTLNVRVPEHWYGTNSFDYFAETFPMSLTPQQKPYGSYEKQVLTINIPPKSKIDVSRQIKAYQLVCSFEALLEDKATGQRYTLTGKWKGLLQYDNASTALAQHALP